MYQNMASRGRRRSCEQRRLTVCRTALRQTGVLESSVRERVRVRARVRARVRVCACASVCACACALYVSRNHAYN